MYIFAILEIATALRLRKKLDRTGFSVKTGWNGVHNHQKTERWNRYVSTQEKWENSWRSTRSLCSNKIIRIQSKFRMIITPRHMRWGYVSYKWHPLPCLAPTISTEHLFVIENYWGLFLFFVSIISLAFVPAGAGNWAPTPKKRLNDVWLFENF